VCASYVSCDGAERVAQDQFVTITDSNGTPVGVQFIAPSVTTYTYQNPSFRHSAFFFFFFMRARV
jgi:hypothetical protein